MVAIRKCRKYLAAITIWFMVFTSIPFGSISVLAADGESIAEGDFEGKENGILEIKETATYDSITIPDGKQLAIIGAAVTVTGEVHIGKNAQLTIVDAENGNQGTLTAGSLTYDDGAKIFVVKNYNLPIVAGSVISVWDVPEGDGDLIDVSGDGEWSCFTLVHDGDTDKWVVNHPEEGGSGQSIPAENFTVDPGDGRMRYVINEDSSFTSITVPDEAELVIEGCTVNVTGETSLGNNSQLTVFNVTNAGITTEGHFSTATFVFGSSVFVYAYKNYNLPVVDGVVIPVYDYPDGIFTNVSNDPNWDNFTLVYDGDNNYWVRFDPTICYYYGDLFGAEKFIEENLLITSESPVKIEGAEVMVTGSFSISNGGELEICNYEDGSGVHTGKLTLADGVTPNFEGGVRLHIKTPENFPSFITPYMYDEDIDSLVEMSNEDIVNDMSFIYDGKAEKWVIDTTNPSGPSDDNPGDQLAWERLQQEYSGYFAFGDWVGYKTADDKTVVDNLKTCIAVSLVEEFTYYVDSASSTEIHGGSRYQREGKEIGLQGYINHNGLTAEEESENATRLANNIGLLKGMITDKTSEISDATLHFNNLEEDLKVYTFEVKIPYGSEDQKEYCTFDVKVVETPHTTDIIVEVGDERYLYNADVEGDKGDYSNIEGVENTRAITVYTDEPIYDEDRVNDVTVYGNFASENEDEILSDETAVFIYAVTIHGGKPSCFESHEFSGKMAVIKKSFIGLAVKPNTAYEGANYVPDYMDANTYYPLTETTMVIDKNTINYDVYYGYDSITLTGYVFIDEYGKLTQTNLASVTCNLGNAVTIDDNNDGTFTVTFNSDYYENVDLILEYEDYPYDRHINIHRTGIVIENGRTGGNNTGSQQIFHGHNGGEDIVKGDTIPAWTSKTDFFEYIIYATYYYPADVAETGSGSSVDLFVTLTFADGSVESKLVESKYHTSVRDDGHIANQKGNAMDDYVIYIGTAQDAPVSVSAIAVPKPDENGVVSRALFGQGIGVTKSINISDIER